MRDGRTKVHSYALSAQLSPVSTPSPTPTPQPSPPWTPSETEPHSRKHPHPKDPRAPPRSTPGGPAANNPRIAATTPASVRARSEPRWPARLSRTSPKNVPVESNGDLRGTAEQARPSRTTGSPPPEPQHAGAELHSPQTRGTSDRDRGDRAIGATYYVFSRRVRSLVGQWSACAAWAISRPR